MNNFILVEKYWIVVRAINVNIRITKMGDIRMTKSVYLEDEVIKSLVL